MKLICITGSGRSGSTLLSLLLSQNDDVFNLGQFRDLWWAWNEEVTCACTAPIRRCEFWSRALPAIAPGDDDRVNCKRLLNRYLRESREFADLSRPETADLVAGRHVEFVRMMARSFEACAQISRRDVFVESSKMPELAFAYAQVPGIELRVINLVRDPRAVAYSWHRRHGDRERVVKLLGEWKRRQDALTRWSPVLGERYRELRYEDFVVRPRSTVRELLEWSGVDNETGFFDTETEATISWHDQHIYPPANETMLSRRETGISIAGSADWRRGTRFGQQLDALRHTWPAGPKYVLGNLFRRATPAQQLTRD